MANKNSALVLKIFILLAKLKKPLLRKLASLKKMRKLKLLEQYSYYSYVKEYEFSPSTTPMIQFRRMSKNGRPVVGLKKLYSDLVVICRSLMGSRRKKEMYRFEMGANSLMVCGEESAAAVAGEIMGKEEEEDDDDDDDGGVDERAERFIQSFYEEMRRQRNNESNFQLLLQN